MKPGAQDYTDILAVLARLLHANGISPDDMSRTFKSICAQLPSRPAARRQRLYLHDLPMAIAEWYRNPDYVDMDGQPLPLPLTGARSVQSLVNRVMGAKRVPEALRRLVRNRVIRKRGNLYLPTDRRIVYRDDDARTHGLEALRGLLHTLDHNLSQPAPRYKVFECIASHDAVPVDALARFDQRIRAPAVEFLNSADLELGRLYQPQQRRPNTTRMGVGVFMFAHDMSHGQARPTSKRARRP